jgi:hypothetical protein
MTMRRIGLLVLIAALATASIAVARSVTREPVPLASPGDFAAIGHARGDLKARFDVLRRGATPSVAPAVDPTYARSVGLNLGEARSVRNDVVVAPADGTTCTVRDSGAAVCTPNELVGTDFLVESSCDGNTVVSGLVPDGTASVVIRRQDGSTQTVGVANNFMEAAVAVASESDVPVAVEYAGASYRVPPVSPDCSGM